MTTRDATATKAAISRGNRDSPVVMLDTAVNMEAPTALKKKIAKKSGTTKLKPPDRVLVPTSPRVRKYWRSSEMLVTPLWNVRRFPANSPRRSENRRDRRPSNTSSSALRS